MRELLFVGVILAFVVATALGQGTPLPWADDDDTKETARRIELGVSHTGYLWPRGDRDFYRLELGGAGLLRIRVAGVAANLRPAVRVHDSPGVHHFWMTGEFGTDLNVTSPIKRRDSYWIEIADATGSNQSTTPYTLELDFLPVDDIHEPNDDDDQATRVTLPATLEGYLFPPLDTDRFRFHLPEQGCLQIILTGIEPEGGSRIMVVGEDGRKVTGEGSTPKQPRAGGWFVERTLGYQNLLLNVNHRGVYTLLLQQVRPIVGLRPYRLRLEFHPTSRDPYEPNDTAAHARRIFPGERVQAWIMPSRDQDFYRIYLRGHGRLLIRQWDLRGGLGSALNVFDPLNRRSMTGGWRHAPTGATVHEIEVPIDGWGDYFVAVGSPDGLTASIDPYFLRVSFLSRHKGAPWVPAAQGVPPPPN